MSRENGFTALRLLCAFLVLYTHCFVVTQQGTEPLLKLTRQISFGTLGVDCFFAISGYLVCGSLLRDPRPLAFLRSRVLRIYPALITVVLVSVFVVGPWLSPDPGYWRSAVTWKYLWTASLYGYHEFIAGLFAGNPVHVVNGSLWTLGQEFTCYLLLLALSWSRALTARMLAFLIGLTLLFHVGEAFPPLRYLFQMELMRMNRFSILFFGGALLAVLGERVRYDWRLGLAGFAFVAVTLVYVPFWQAAIAPYFLLLPYLLITAARSLKSLSWLNRWDASYGFYLYAFLVQQVLETLIGPSMGPRRMALYATPIVLLCGLVSWVAIEKPALSLKARREV